MSDTTGTALLAIRVWCEEGSRHPLRAEIRLTHDVAVGFRPTMRFIQADDVVEAVRDFLDTVLCSSPDDSLVTPVSRPGHG